MYSELLRYVSTALNVRKEYFRRLEGFIEAGGMTSSKGIVSRLLRPLEVSEERLGSLTNMHMYRILQVYVPAQGRGVLPAVLGGIDCTCRWFNN